MAATDYLWKSISLDDGLSHSNVTSLARDNRGFLWIGTRFGLNRYDFEKVRSYYKNESQENSLVDNNINHLYADPYGKLWIGTDKGLCVYNEHSDNFSSIQCEGKPIVARSFCEEDDGLLIGGQGGVYYHDRASGSTVKLQTKGGSNYAYTSIYPWTSGFYILTTRWDGAWLMDRTLSTIQPLTSIGEKEIRASLVDSRGRLWIAPYGKGVRLYDRSGNLVDEFSTANAPLGSNIVLNIAEVNGNIWFATEGCGITVYNPADKKFDNSEETDNLRNLNSVTTLYTDGSSNIYAGTVREGAAAIIPVAMHPVAGSSRQSFKAVTASCIMPDGTVWLGDDGNGLAKYTPSTHKVTYAPSTSGLKITDIESFDDHKIIVSAFEKGFYIYDTSSEKLSRPEGNAESFAAINPKGTLAVRLRRVAPDIIAFLSDDFHIYNISTGKLSKIADRNPQGGILQPFYNNDGRLLCADDHTVYEFSAVTSSLSPLATLAPEERLLCAAFDGGHNVYAGTETGVKRIDISTGEMWPICSNIDERVAAMAFTHPNKLWIATTSTLYLKDIKPGYCNENIIGFSRADGVNPNEYLTNATISSDGNMLLFGGTNGLLHINTEDTEYLLSHRPASTLSLADVVVDGVSSFQDVDADGKIRINGSYTQLTLSIIDNGGNSVKGQLYRYIISDGHTERTVETFARTINLNFLSSGRDYSVSASTNEPDGAWSTPQPIIRMALIAPWWKSSIGMAFIVALCIGSIAFWEWRRSQLRAERIKSKMEAYRNDALRKEVTFFVNTNYALRTPLTLIYAPVKLLIEQLRNGENVDVATELEGIYRNTKKMRDTIDMALELHKIGTSVQEKPSETHDVARSIQDVIKVHHHEAEIKQICVKFLPTEEMFPAIYDRNRINTVLETLLLNALQRSVEGDTVSIRITSNEGNVRVSVSDMGQTLDEETMNHLFSEYFHDDNSTFGNSIGFAFAKSIVEILGGNIGVQNNTEGAGITVWFEIPAADTISDAAYRKRRKNDEVYVTIPETEAVVRDINTSNLTAVVVEEDNDLCLFIVRQLEPYFNRVLHAFNGKDALLLIKQNQPDIVISSVMLPIKSGLELCHDLKTSPETSHIPVILLTAVKEGAILETAYNAGADSYLSKPFDVQILLTRCRNLLHSRATIRKRYESSTGVPKLQTNADESFMLKVDKIIADNISDPEFGVDVIVELMALSRSSLYSKFKSLTGGTIGSYIADKRLSLAKDYLLSTDLSVSEIAEKLGFNTQRYFSTFFKERTGVSPSSYRHDTSANSENGES